jgi:hypothetical protein
MLEVEPIFFKEPFSAEILSIQSKLQPAQFTQKDSPFTPRMLTYYDSKELLFNASEKGKKRLFSGDQFFWLHILNEVAKLGYNQIENLQIIKFLFENRLVFDSKMKKFNFLEYVLATIIYTGIEHHLKIDEEGSYSIFSYHNLDRLVEGNFITRASHINIALGPIANTIWKRSVGEEIKFKKPTKPIIAHSDKELLELIHNEEYESVEIIKKKDKEYLIRVIEKEPVSNKRDLHQMLSSMKFGTVTLKYNGDTGNPTTIIKETTIKRKKH